VRGHGDIEIRMIALACADGVREAVAHLAHVVGLAGQHILPDANEARRHFEFAQRIRDRSIVLQQALQQDLDRDFADAF